MSDPPSFIHDTRHILYANAEACELFRCELEGLIDLDMMELIVNPEFAGLAKLRMTMMRQEQIPPPFKFKYRRCDGSKFWAWVVSQSLGNGEFETTLIYDSEA